MQEGHCRWCLDCFDACRHDDAQHHSSSPRSSRGLMAFSFVFTTFSRCHFTQTLYATQALYEIIAYASRLWEYRTSKALNENDILFYCIIQHSSHTESLSVKDPSYNSGQLSVDIRKACFFAANFHIYKFLLPIVLIPAHSLRQVPILGILPP